MKRAIHILPFVPILLLVSCSLSPWKKIADIEIPEDQGFDFTYCANQFPDSVVSIRSRSSTCVPESAKQWGHILSSTDVDNEGVYVSHDVFGIFKYSFDGDLIWSYIPPENEWKPTHFLVQQNYVAVLERKIELLMENSHPPIVINGNIPAAYPWKQSIGCEENSERITILDKQGKVRSATNLFDDKPPFVFDRHWFGQQLMGQVSDDQFMIMGNAKRCNSSFVFFSPPLDQEYLDHQRIYSGDVTEVYYAWNVREASSRFKVNDNFEVSSVGADMWEDEQLQAMLDSYFRVGYGFYTVSGNTTVHYLPSVSPLSVGFDYAFDKSQLKIVDLLEPDLNDVVTTFQSFDKLSRGLVPFYVQKNSDEGMSTAEIIVVADLESDPDTVKEKARVEFSPWKAYSSFGYATDRNGTLHIATGTDSSIRLLSYTEEGGIEETKFQKFAGFVDADVRETNGEVYVIVRVDNGRIVVYKYPLE